MLIRSVSDITAYIKALLDGDELLADLWVAGEVSNSSRAASGHLYFTLKDASAEMRCVMWRTQAARLASVPRQGDWVEAHGYISVYERGGAYQFYTDLLRPAGIGALWQQFQALKDRLQAEGLFDPARKRPLPRWPQRIGIVTSPTGAALQDMLKVLRERYPLVQVFVASSLVQGAEAPPSLVRGIEALNAVGDIDVIVLARGGGSMEDLWAFNDERVARAVAASQAPVVTGVGHEVDFTIVDFVADFRAPTPTAAAATVVPDGAELLTHMEQLVHRATVVMQDRIARSRESLQREERVLRLYHPVRILAVQRQRLDEAVQRLQTAWSRQLSQRRMTCRASEARLQALWPQRVLERGYAILQRQDTGAMIHSVRQVVAGDGIDIYLHDGLIGAQVLQRHDSEKAENGGER